MTPPRSDRPAGAIAGVFVHSIAAARPAREPGVVFVGLDPCAPCSCDMAGQLNANEVAAKVIANDL
jgi:hypothetical protein